MKKLILAALAALSVGTAVAPAHADWVNGYWKGNGTYVGPYYRTHADGWCGNNLSGC
jgi:hypothetical protein